MGFYICHLMDQKLILKDHIKLAIDMVIVVQ